MKYELLTKTFAIGLFGAVAISGCTKYDPETYYANTADQVTEFDLDGEVVSISQQTLEEWNDYFQETCTAETIQDGCENVELKGVGVIQDAENDTEYNDPLYYVTYEVTADWDNDGEESKRNFFRQIINKNNEWQLTSQAFNGSFASESESESVSD